MKIVIGIDVGNYDTKTQHTTIPSSYQESDCENKLTQESLFYNGKFYNITRTRDNQMLDKTEGNYCIIMSLFAIAKEIIWQIEKKSKTDLTNEQLQEKISKYDQVSIGAGLPVGFFSSQAKRMQECYESCLGNGFSFVFKGFTFNLDLVKCRIFPQDFMPVISNKKLLIPQKYPKYYIIGIGGGTVDIIPVINGEPQVSSCKSIEKGTTFMYEYISTSIQRETGRTMDHSSIESILRGENSIVDEKRKNRVKQLADSYTNKLVDDMIHAGLRLSDYPCVMIGGGALLMKKSLKKNQQFVSLDFINDVNANAKYFALYVSEG